MKIKIGSSIIERVCNIKDELKELFEECWKDYENDICRNSEGEWVSKPNPLIHKYMNKKILNRYDGSFFALNTNACEDWHIDRPGNFYIATYPYPTQIILLDEEIDKDGSYYTDYFCREEKRSKRVQTLLSTGAAKIFTPEVGDLYRLEGNVIHRANPQGQNSSRLCARVWYESPLGE